MQNSPVPVALVIAAAVALVLLLGVAFLRGRRKVANAAREQFELASEEHRRLSGRVDDVDATARSLTSHLADAGLLDRWEECRESFRQVGGRLTATGLTSGSPDREFRRNAGTVTVLLLDVARMDAAQNSIGLLAAMEQGDHDVRRSELAHLAGDLAASRRFTTDEGLQDRLRAVEEQTEALATALGAPDFMDRFADTVADYQRVLEDLRTDRMPTLTMDGYDADKGRRAPRIDERSYRAGCGYDDWVPFTLLARWHAEDTRGAGSSASPTTLSFNGRPAEGDGPADR
ncbi:MAG: hypothetical protein ACTH1D_03795 [Mycobacteriaceae bacterium]|uniref:hypothetical protein n=1 Tax=Corynebacterium sp. TaxID=1720 RepID=UPI003F957B09